MNKRVYGVTGTGVYAGSPNNGWGGTPNRLEDEKGTFINSFGSTKYAIRNMANQDGEKILCFKSMNEKSNWRTLDERYVYLTGDKKPKSNLDIVKNILELTFDGKQFGSTYAGKLGNIGIHGAVHIHHGRNVFEQASTTTLTVTSPFLNSNKVKSEDSGDDEKSASQTTLGEKTVINEGHFLQQFSINPNNYQELIEQGLTEGYTTEDYAKFKNYAIKAISNLDTTQKSGCFNEFAIFIEAKENESLNLGNLTKKIKVYKDEDDDMLIYDLSKLDWLEDMDAVDNIEIYYDESLIQLKTVLNSKTKFISINSLKKLNK